MGSRHRRISRRRSSSSTDRSVDASALTAVRSLRPQLPRERDVGRALRLLMINVGRARPGEISMSTFGHPGRYTFCIGENEEASPRPPFHAGRGLPAGTSALYSHTMLVVGPEHARTFG